MHVNADLSDSLKTSASRISHIAIENKTIVDMSSETCEVYENSFT